MRTMMMTLAILISACGVDDPKTVKLRNATMDSATPPATTDPQPEADGDLADEPQYCFFSTDCDVGTCDRATHTCVGDEPIDHNPNAGD